MRKEVYMPITLDDLTRIQHKLIVSKYPGESVQRSAYIDGVFDMFNEVKTLIELNDGSDARTHPIPEPMLGSGGTDERHSPFKQKGHSRTGE
jgi:hypothetical protein